MAYLVEPGSEGVKELMRRLDFAQTSLLYGALGQVRAAFSAVKYDAQFGALVDSYHDGVEKTNVLVEIVLRMFAAPSRFSQLDGEVEGLALLLLSLGGIERCTQSGRCYMSRSSELPDSAVGNSRSSRTRFFLLRELFFSVDLARVAFLMIMLQARIHLDESWGSRRQPRIDMEEEFCNRPAHELFEWCERRRRPVLKQRALDLGQEIMQHIPLNEPAALLGLDALSRMKRCNPWGLWTADAASEWEKPSAKLRDSVPLNINFHDVHDQKFFGCDSYGDIYRCSWHGKSAAMKLIKFHPETSELECFQMEVSILASLQHPNALPVFAIGYTEGRAEGFFVMEHMQTDLVNVIRERRKQRGEWRGFPLDVAVDIMSQIVEGMCTLRLQGVIHQDLNPANILVNRPDESMGPLEGFYDVKLAEIGCANVEHELNSVFYTLQMGTPGYMAPEVMSPTLLPERKGEHGYSWKADVYSFAMVCAEILSGEPPFRHINGPTGERLFEHNGIIADILAAVRGGERPELPLDGGDPLRRLIEDCWKFNAEERPDFGEVRRRLWECRVYHFFRAGRINKLANVWH